MVFRRSGGMLARRNREVGGAVDRHGARHVGSRGSVDRLAGHVVASPPATAERVPEATLIGTWQGPSILEINTAMIGTLQSGSDTCGATGWYFRRDRTIEIGETPGYDPNSTVVPMRRWLPHRCDQATIAVPRGRQTLNPKSLVLGQHNKWRMAWDPAKSS